MRFNNILFSAFIFCMGTFASFSQQETTTMEEISFEKFDFNGYVKFMPSLVFNDEGTVLMDNLVHNRLNFSFYSKKGATVVAQFRNRIFFGESVRSIPDYGEYVNKYDGVLPLEWRWINNGNVVANTIVDRFYYDYSNEKFQLRIGRQRINWGINTTWNPNDIFNSYNIYDFDYEEREGADAIRMKFFPNYFSSFDIAYKFTGNWDDDVFALNYKMNKWNYDFQFQAGKFQHYITFGTGWAGSLGLIGFKGEANFFNSYTAERNNALSASTSFDYAFNNGLYLLGTYLFNSTGTNNIIDPTLPVFNNPDAANLMPTKHNVMFQGSYPISPILNASLGTIYSYGINNVTIFPMVTYGLLTNLDVDFIGQFFWQETPTENFQNIGNVVYCRFKYSF